MDFRQWVEQQSYVNIGHNRHSCIWAYHLQKGFEVKCPDSDEKYGLEHDREFRSMFPNLGAETLWGRYDPQTKELSIWTGSWDSDISLSYFLNQEVIPKLEKRFDFKKPHIFDKASF